MKTGGKLNLCPLCVEEQADPRNPRYKDADHRKKPPIPCPEHGDPQLLYPENREALEIYQKISPYHIVRAYGNDGETKQRVNIDMALTLQICAVYGVEDVPEMLDKIEIIHNEIYHE